MAVIRTLVLSCAIQSYKVILAPGFGERNDAENRTTKTYSQTTKKQVLQVEIPVRVQAQEANIDQTEGEKFKRIKE